MGAPDQKIEKVGWCIISRLIAVCVSMSLAVYCPTMQVASMVHMSKNEKSESIVYEAPLLIVELGILDYLVAASLLRSSSPTIYAMGQTYAVIGSIWFGVALVFWMLILTDNFPESVDDP